MHETAETLVGRLLEVEGSIQKAPPRRGAGPYDVNPDLVRLALEEADLLEGLREGGG